MARIRGSYPGGPKREGRSDGRDDAEARRPRLETVEQIEERVAHASRTRQRRRRARRVWAGFVVALALAAGTGFVLGIRSHRSSEQLTAERNVPRPPQAFDPSFETNRMLMELWKMEADEVRPPLKP